MDNNHTQNFDHLEYTVIRSNRKSICIEISPDLQIKVRAPQKMLDSQIRAFVASKDKWITDHLAIMQERLESQAADTYRKPLSGSELAVLAQKASIVIPERVKHFAPIIGVTYGRITIRHQKTRWGSCSSSGNLNFNCMLMTTTPELIDYVVVHELCHRRQMNHSPRFWARVGSVMPDYEIWKKWLKAHGGKLGV